MGDGAASQMNQTCGRDGTEKTKEESRAPPPLRVTVGAENVNRVPGPEFLEKAGAQWGRHSRGEHRCCAIGLVCSRPAGAGQSPALPGLQVFLLGPSLRQPGSTFTMAPDHHRADSSFCHLPDDTWLPEWRHSSQPGLPFLLLTHKPFALLRPTPPFLGL